MVLKSLYNYYQFLFSEYKDPRVENYPFLGSPWPVISVVILYLYFVMKWGPELMKNRDPYELKGLMNFYNFVQIVANIIIGTVVRFCCYDQITI